MRKIMISLVMMAFAAGAFATDDGNTKKSNKTAVQQFSASHNYKNAAPVVKTEEEMQSTGTPAIIPSSYKQQNSANVNNGSGQFEEQNSTSTYSNPAANPRNYKIK